jgi:8-oxo-dGTP diphosphatase
LATEVRRQAHIYVFCLLHHQLKDLSFNPLNLDQWTFYILHTSVLNEKFPQQKSLSLKSLENLNPSVAKYEEIKSCVEKLAGPLAQHHNVKARIAVKHFHIALALIWRDGHILAARRRDDAEHLPGLWEFPGGKCEDGETPRECAVREAREEVGVEIEISGERAAITHQYAERRVTLHPFDCRIISGEPQAFQRAALRWLRPDELRAEDFPAANTALIEEIQRAAAPPDGG